MTRLATDRRSQRHRASAAFGLSIPGFGSRDQAFATCQNLDIAYFQCPLRAGCCRTTISGKTYPLGLVFFAACRMFARDPTGSG
jgi:hypothetical protein